MLQGTKAYCHYPPHFTYPLQIPVIPRNESNDDDNIDSDYCDNDSDEDDDGNDKLYDDDVEKYGDDDDDDYNYIDEDFTHQ